MPFIEYIGDKMKKEINIEYSRTEYRVLNQNIMNYINQNIYEFNKTSHSVEQDFTYSLNIRYEEYLTKNYISYIFYTSVYEGGAHPNNTIYTINYDKRNNRIVTINDLIKMNPTILDIFSKKSREELSKKEGFNDPNVKEMMIEGTKPIPNNYKNFVFTKDKIMILFEQYQVAPYYMGEFKIII